MGRLLRTVGRSAVFLGAVAAVLAFGTKTARADIATGLVVQYDFENNYVDSAHAYNGTANGSGYSFVTGPTGLGQALQLTGTSGYVTASGTVGHMPIGTSDRTLAFWANLTTPAGNCTPFAWGTNATGQGSRIALTNGTIYYSGWGDDVTLGTLPTATWTHVAVSLSGSTATLYLNGSASGSATLPTTPNTTDTNAFAIGSSTPAPLVLCPGIQMDDVRVYSRALSAADVSQLAAWTPSSAAPIPTLSEWGMMAMFCSLGVAMFFAMNKRRGGAAV